MMSCFQSEDVCFLHGGAWGRYGCPTNGVLESVRKERARQFTQYGVNKWEDGTGPKTAWLLPLSSVSAEEAESVLRADYEEFEEEVGEITWVHLVREEIAEAFQENDPDRLEAELLQVAALAVAWVEDIRSRKDA